MSTTAAGWVGSDRHAPELAPFANEPTLELRRAAARATLEDGLRRLDAQLPLRVPVWIGGDRRDGEELVSTDPADPERVVALAAKGTPADAHAAVAAAKAAYPTWAATPARERAAALLRAATWLRERRAELAALALREAGKPWGEADADVCEAIDFLEYYARGAIELERGPELLQVPGERNALHYAPRGVCAVISPWNFPLAIPLGMTAAALATGNTAVLKPAEQAPGCALRIVEALRAGGVPAGAVALLPGEGDAGAALAEHPDVATIAFTGSGPVGLGLVKVAAEVPVGGRQLKRVVAEMGGKNCVIVDADADLDDAVPAIVQSAFVYAGQKCSAAARVLVHEAIADALVERLAGAVEVLEVGPAEAWGIDVPPVIEREAQERVERYARLARESGRVVAEASGAPGGGWYVPPRVVADLPADSPVLQEEIFGPLLAVEHVRDVDEACDRIDALPFALTGGLFCRNPRTVDRVVARSPVGNLYVNRSITGAMVGRQPFGGNRLSGTGTKAGGPDYLLHFVEPRVVTENTVRHGLVVD
jgi:RHH-type proline utilization regulon transcriptional repressor/proline dehydrogenase/delta 1-pyrroline-5-carboxylate dehydrogenase